MHVFRDDVKKILLESGWKQGRKVDITKFKDSALIKGYKWFEAAERFLTEFVNLKICFFRENGYKDLLHFDVIKSMEDFDPLWIKDDYYFRIGNKDLCVIGQTYSNHLTLMIDYEGRIYGGFDDSLYVIGINGYEAIETICLNKPLKEI